MYYRGLQNVDDDINWAIAYGAEPQAGYPGLPIAGYTYPTAGQIVYGKGVVGGAVGGVERYEQQSINTTLSIVAALGVGIMLLALLKGRG